MTSRDRFIFMTQVWLLCFFGMVSAWAVLS